MQTKVNRQNWKTLEVYLKEHQSNIKREEITKSEIVEQHPLEGN